MPLLVLVGALLLSATLTRWIRDYSVARGWASIPSSDRHVHTRPIPRLGGVAIFLTLWCMVLVAHRLPWRFSTGEFAWPHLALKILRPPTIIFVLPLIDDFFVVAPHVKFPVHS